MQLHNISEADFIEQEPTKSAPTPQRDWALFLDIDGTLLDIAMSPDAVIVPDFLVPLLARAQAWLDDALAIVSGRSIDEIDRLMAPLVLPCAGEHGAVMRRADGATEFEEGARVPAAWVERLQHATKDWEGVLVEKKKYGVAVHFRKSPSREADIRNLLTEIIGKDQGEFEVLPASKAFEVRNRKMTKGNAVGRFMSQPPFAGRVPVFVGDDVTDQDGFRAAEAMGGIALDVHVAFAGRPSEVLRWLDAGIPAMGR